MPRNDPNTLYWNSIARTSIQDAYNNFLQQENVESSPHYADIFSIRYLRENGNSAGMSKREMIIFLAGSLPEMYD
ncbi:hypothetical protein AB4189_11970 [Vibrio sp. 10N.286.49.E1]|uniref:hypothetical protein n=1 Tax=unclassified Vibrio TaxID=2614977 RepID=UPI00354E1B66